MVIGEVFFRLALPPITIVPFYIREFSMEKSEYLFYLSCLLEDWIANGIILRNDTMEVYSFCEMLYQEIYSYPARIMDDLSLLEKWIYLRLDGNSSMTVGLSFIDYIDDEDEDNRYIYIASDGNKYKIGVSVNTYSRVSSLNTDNPKEVKIIYSKKFKNASKVEHKIHENFKSNRVKGEWFNFTENELSNVINYIKNYQDPLHKSKKISKNTKVFQKSTDTYIRGYECF